MSAGREDEPSDQDVMDDALAGRIKAGRGPAAAPPVITGSGRTTANGAIERPEPPITVEQAYRAKLKAARDARSAEPGTPTVAGPPLRSSSDPAPERTVDADPGTSDDPPTAPPGGPEGRAAAGSVPALGHGPDTVSGAGPDRATPSVRPAEIPLLGPTGVAPRAGTVATPGPANQVRPLAVRRPAPPPGPPAGLRARPRVEPEVGILGLSRHSRSRLGSRLFTLFFVFVFGLILVQLIVTLLQP